MNNDKLYNIFMSLIATLSNEELQKLADSITEYINNDK